MARRPRNPLDTRELRSQAMDVGLLRTTHFLQLAITAHKARKHHETGVYLEAALAADSEVRSAVASALEHQVRELRGLRQRSSNPKTAASSSGLASSPIPKDAGAAAELEPGSNRKGPAPGLEAALERREHQVRDRLEQLYPRKPGAWARPPCKHLVPQAAVNGRDCGLAGGPCEPELVPTCPYRRNPARPMSSAEVEAAGLPPGRRWLELDPVAEAELPADRELEGDRAGTISIPRLEGDLPASAESLEELRRILERAPRRKLRCSWCADEATAAVQRPHGTNDRRRHDREPPFHAACDRHANLYLARAIAEPIADGDDSSSAAARASAEDDDELDAPTLDPLRNRPDLVRQVDDGDEGRCEECGRLTARLERKTSRDAWRWKCGACAVAPDLRVSGPAAARLFPNATAAKGGDDA